MLLLDFNGIAIAAMMESLDKNTHASDIDMEMIRHMILNTLRYLKSKFNEHEMIICCDSRHYWRKDFFPYYKANRKKDREKSPLDWNKIHACFNQMKSELRETFPYRILEIDGAEADDIIGVLVHEYGTELNSGEEIIICSSDKDFKQLHSYGNVRQYDPIRTKDWVTCEDPEVYLKEHIIKGDRGDGIPTIINPSNCLVLGIRQKPLMSKKLKEWINKEPIDFCDPVMLARYIQNRTLIDLNYIPDDLSIKILDEYNSQENKKSGNLFNYFMKHSLKQHLSNIQDFK